MRDNPVMVDPDGLNKLVAERATLRAQRDSLLAALEELLDSIQAVNNSMEDFHIWGPRLKNACLDAGKAIAAVKQEGE